MSLRTVDLRALFSNQLDAKRQMKNPDRNLDPGFLKCYPADAV
jgi:hypothetical protein